MLWCKMTSRARASRYHITPSVNHLICPLPPHQSLVWLAHCHHISQLFDLPTATTSSVRASTRDRANTSARHRALPYHCISQSFDLPHATTSVSHVTCPLPPHWSVIWLGHCPLPPHQSVFWLALYHSTTHHCITTSVSHLTCPLLPHQSVIWLAHCHHISQSFDLPSTTALPRWSVFWLAPTITSVHHLTCLLPPIRQSFDLPTATTSLCPHHP